MEALAWFVVGLESGIALCIFIELYRDWWIARKKARDGKAGGEG